MIWIVAAVIGVVIVGGILFLIFGRREDEVFEKSELTEGQQSLLAALKQASETEGDVVINATKEKEGQLMYTIDDFEETNKNTQKEI